MNPEPIRDALKRQPFQPFQIVMASGQRYTIEHPDFLAVGPGPVPRDLVIWTEIGSNRGHFQTHWLNIRQVAELVSPIEAPRPPQAQGNGA